MYSGGLIYGIDSSYILLIVVTFALGIASQAYINSTYKRWSRVRSSAGVPGAQVARQMLDAEGASQVGIDEIPGELTDNYNPKDNKLHLSHENFAQGSVAGVAVACHEAGHAVQNARGFVPMRIRSALVPVVNFASTIWIFVLLAGSLLHIAGLTTAAIVLFSFSVLFHLVTLPVEIDASRRAVAYIASSGLSDRDVRGARSVLTAAALTYVSAALISILQLLYLLGRNNRN